MKIYLIPDKRMNKRVSHLPGVVKSVRNQANRIADKAEVRLAAHRYEGQAEITVSYGRTDSFVNLDDPAALSIEFGHDHNVTGKPVKGLYIVTGAAGLA